MTRRVYLDIEDWRREWAEVIAARKIAILARLSRMHSAYRRKRR